MKTLLIATLLLLPSVGIAATIDVNIDTLGQSVNAIEGKIVIPSWLSVKDIYTGNSEIVFWVQSPVYDDASHSVSFAGLTPGGFLGKGTLFSITGDFAAGDEALLKSSGVIALKNDGLGTKVPVKISFLSANPAQDIFSPEPFPITVSKSESLFEGKTFASFSATDKGLGLDHYDVAEKLIGSPQESDWHTEASPYEIKDSSLLKNVFVRAVDKAGNSRIESVALPHRHIALGILAIIFIASCAFALRTRYSRFS